MLKKSSFMIICTFAKSRTLDMSDVCLMIYDKPLNVVKTQLILGITVDWTLTWQDVEVFLNLLVYYGGLESTWI